MASSWLLLAFVASVQLIVVRSGNVVPVLLWSGDASNELIYPLHKTSRSEFEKLLAERVAKTQPPMMVFVKENFCVEEIKHHKESLQQLNKAGSLTYFTSVESAISTFENLPNYNVTVEDDFETVTDGQLVEVPINDISAIPDVYNVIRESSPNIVIALTGKSCSYSSSDLKRARRAVADIKVAKNESDSLIVSPENKILLYVDKRPVLKINGTEHELKTLTSSTVNKFEKNRTEVQMNFATDTLGAVNLVMAFNTSMGYVKLVDFTYTVEGKPEKIILKSKTNVEFPTGNFSFHCSRNVQFTGIQELDDKEKTKITIALSLINMQVQLNTTVFGDVYDCVGFTTVPIWMGLFVTLLLGLIMIWGVAMIMDIRTMDRFDDPKGKTITVTAQE